MRSIQKKVASLALVGGLAVFGAACEAETDVVEDPAQEEAPLEDDGLGEGTEDDGMTDDGATDDGATDDGATETETEGDS